MSDDPKQKGKWEEPFSIENVACHATLLPNGKILCWSRRSNPMSPTADMNEQKTNAFLVDLNAKGGPRCSYTGNQPQSFASGPSDAQKARDISLFCSGHCLMADGKVFVVGGHIEDGVGQDQACIYDYQQNSWTAKPPPGIKRWYPSALSLPNSSVLAISGSSEKDHPPEEVPQIWSGEQWNTNPVQSLAMAGQIKLLPLYPRLHVQPNGKVLMAGPNASSLSLDLNAVNILRTKDNKDITITGQWGSVLERKLKLRENGASVTYDVGKILWVAGGNDVAKPVAGFSDKVDGPPTGKTEFINVNAENAAWVEGQSLKTPRRQHNLTTLPDGTVLVTGGTSGLGFNDLRSGKPVHTAELWNPAQSKSPKDVEWVEMAAESTDRCYHGVALLLPDGSVFSAGSGEGGEFDNPPNPPVRDPSRNNHTNAQIYKPPYFFIDAEVPKVAGVPSEVNYGKPFDVTIQSSSSINRISWIRLPSVTHGLNSSQSVYFEMPKVLGAGKLTVTPPDNPNIATPGYYMLFFVSEKGRPSVASIIRIMPEDKDKQKKEGGNSTTDKNKPNSRLIAHTGGSLQDLDQRVVAELNKPAVKVGLTPVCPYGLGPCWAGAFEGLHHIEDVDVVRPLPDSANSVAYVYLKEDKLPDIDVWRKEMAHIAGGTYNLRGIELQLKGQVKKQQDGDGDNLVLCGSSTRPDVTLSPFEAASKLERDHKAQALMPASDDELKAYTSLVELVAGKVDGVVVEVTGRLHKHAENRFSLDVRTFALEADAKDA